jgi:hypothetical protein
VFDKAEKRMMKKPQTGHEREEEKPSSKAQMLIEVLVRRPHRDCPLYTWAMTSTI